MTDVVEGEVVEEEDVKGVEVVRHVPQLPAEARELSVDELMAQVEKVREIQRRVMRPGVHYGNVPGVDKPGLSKAGAETLNLTFKMAPRYRVTKTYDGGHLTVDVICELYHRLAGNFIGEGVGMCSTREEKYAYRMAARTCPVCKKEAIIKGREEYGGGWVCFKKKDGCGAKFADDSPDGLALAKATVGKVDNDRLPDAWNTVEKMAKKRALVDAVLTATAAGDVFTQDVDEAPSGETPADTPTPHPADSAGGSPEGDAGGEPTDGAPPPLQGLDLDIKEVRDEVYELADKLGARANAEETVGKNYAKHMGEGGDGKSAHLSWLKRQRTTMRANVKEREKAAA